MGKRPLPLADTQPAKQLREELSGHDHHQGKVWIRNCSFISETVEYYQIYENNLMLQIKMTFLKLWEFS